MLLQSDTFGAVGNAATENAKRLNDCKALHHDTVAAWPADPVI